LLVEARELLDRVDWWVGEGLLNGEELSVADFVIAPSVALLAYHRDLAEEIERRPAGQMLDRVFASRSPEPASPL
jgi:hypothetical protein